MVHYKVLGGFLIDININLHNYIFGIDTIDIKLIEQGCLCLTPDYRVNEPIKRIWTTGYGIVYLDENGIADLNKSKFVCLD